MIRFIFLIFISSCTIFRWTIEEKKERMFIFPVSGEITSYFGKRDGGFHKGIDIAADEGSEIRASCDGVVSYAGFMETYGNLIIILHNDGFSTLYAHNKKNLVKAEQKVKQGDIIGIVGRTGNATKPHLHFEIRKNGIPENPILYLK